jgi:MATE family multidrug resistance protein
MILVLGLPVVLNQLGKYIVSIFSVSLLGRIGKTELAAIGLASSFCNVTGYFTVRGMASAVDTLSTQAFGAGSFHRVGIIAQRATLIITAIAAVPAAILWLNAERILLALQQPADVSRLVQQYAVISLPSLFIYCVQIVIQKTLYATRQTASVLYAQMLSAGVGLVVLFVLVCHYHLGFVGAAWAIASQNILMTVFLVAIAARNPTCRKCWPGWSPEAMKGWGHFLSLALPSCVLCVAEWWSYEIVMFMSGLFLEVGLSSNTVLMQVRDPWHTAEYV